ncbi:ATP-grasp domain-containing protein [Shewanella sp. C32]|uniref:ATP-grasp domain-containing protein n=1 Tax=Shewanella electrica TaxID=515560 RepID=A0ABT2FJB6_9GAMM|nr:ATP-grasp domain-containing protein [Shewanella electrica]MCH1924519.1 ATP-grasp domain-containing protein [Shewanella electrica]MCS4556420.1 ATP-grasp domain-containing protein [Shewanella electrica]
MKNILIIGAGVEACEGIKIAKNMGLGLIIADGNPQAPGFAWADHRIVASTYDGKAIADQAITLKASGVTIDGVIAMCADVPMSVAIVANALHLPGLTLESAHWVADKLAMKDQLKAQNIPIPAYCAVPAKADVYQCAENIGLPLVIKPVDSRGARGVQYIDHLASLESAWELAAQESPTGRVMMEEYLPGPQFSTETLADNGHYYTLGFADRNYEWLEKTKPFMIENGGDSPTAQSAEVKQKVIDVAEQAAKALGIDSGVAKGDMVFSGGQAKVIEIAGRLSGGYFSTTQIPLATGVNFIEKAIKLALGEHLSVQEVTPKHHKGVAIRYLDLAPGRIHTIENQEQAQALAGVEMLSLFIQPGDYIAPLANHTQRAGFVISCADTKADAIAIANNALAQLNISYEV